MPRNSPKQAIRNKKCRSRFVTDTSTEVQQASKPLSRRQFAYQHAAVLNAEVLAEYAVAGWSL